MPHDTPDFTCVLSGLLAKLNEVARALNERPRKTLKYETLAERFGQSVATTR